MNRPFRSVRHRITLLLALAAVGLIGPMVAVQLSWNRQVDLLLKERLDETDLVLERILTLRANGARIHVDDYTRWDDFVAFTRRADPKWGRINLTESIKTFDLDVAWVLNDRFVPIFTANPSTDPTRGALPIPLPALVAALSLKPIDHFFAVTKHGLAEVWTSPIQPSEDFNRTRPVSGYYVVCRIWTPKRLNQLGRDVNAQVRLVPPNRVHEPAISAGTGTVTVGMGLGGIDHTNVAGVEFQTEYPLLPGVRDTLRASLFAVIFGTLLVVLAVGWALSRWMTRPLATITGALHRQDASLLDSAVLRDDELGRLARLVADFFVQRQNLIEAREAADLAGRAKSQFFANISHELRTPMHGILSYARFGLREAATAERDVLLEDFQNIEECGTSLLALLNDLLDLSKFEAGRVSLELEPISMKELVGDAIQEFASLYDEKGMRAEIAVDEALPPVRADRARLTQVLRNLLSNAGKFSKACGAVRVHVEARGPLTRVAVEDAGIGIPQGELERVFDEFVQASQSRTHAGGTGLGLAICRQIVQAHEGRIWAENRDGGGARIVFELPTDGPASATNAAAQEAA